MIASLAGATQKIRELAAARAPRGDFLTVTLSTSRLDDWRQVAPTFLNSEFGRISRERELSKDQKHVLQSELDEIGAVLQYDLTDRTQGLALFANGDGIYERIELPFTLINRMVFEPSPYVRPIVHALSLLEPFIVARVSRDESSLFLVDEWGGVAKEDDLSGPWLRTSDRETGELSIKEYFAAARHDTLIDLHYKDVAATLAKWLEGSTVRRVVLCAQHDIATNFRKALPPAVAPKLVAQIPFDAAVTPSQMLVAARQATNGARKEELAQLLGRINEGLGSSGRGASGFDQVLGGLTRGQIQTMVVDRNYRPPGWRCPDCDWAGLNPVDECPMCGVRPVPIGDAVGELVRLAIMQSSRVEVAEDLPALDEMGGVAALLRFS